MQLKHKFFFWLLLQDRLNTRDLLHRKTFYLEDTSCVLCQDAPMEFMQHLFFGCEFSQIFWWRLNQEWNYDMDLYDMLLDGRARAGHSCFTEYLITGCWSLWCHRNSIIFDGGQLDIDTCCNLFKEFFPLLCIELNPLLKKGCSNGLMPCDFDRRFSPTTCN